MQGGAMSDRADDKTQGKGRRFTPEEREQIKRELKAQMRAYVDALKAQMLANREGGKPDLEEAMSKAEQEAARKIAEQAAQGDPMVEEVARVQAAAHPSAQPAAAPSASSALSAQPAPRSGQQATHHDGMIPKLSSWKPATKQEDEPEKQPTSQPVAQPDAREVLDVASKADEAPPPQAGAAPQAAQPSQASAAIDVNPGEDAGSFDADAAEGQGGYIVPDEEAAKSAIPRDELERLTKDIIAALKTIYDPEIPVDIYELGLIYRIDIADDRTVTIDMTLTAPGCPVAGDMPGWVQKAVAEVEGVNDVKVNLVFDPPWDMSRMSDEARLALNMF